MKIIRHSLIAVSFLTLATTALIGCGKASGPSAPDTPNGSEPAAISGKGETCEQFIANLPANYFHDWLEVPENYLDPANSPKIRVFYYGPKGDFESHVVFFNGGPGSDSHYNFQLFDKAFASFKLDASNLGFVYIDQRGTGCSSHYPSYSSPADMLRDRFYGSTGIVYDAEAVRAHLFGKSKWKVFGQSYGAFIVHRYVALFPDSVSDAYAHANAITSDPVERLAGRLYSQYDVMTKYLAKYPDDRVRLTTLRTYLLGQGKLCLYDGFGYPYCGVEISSLLINKLGFTNHWAGVHERLAKTLESRDDAPVNRDSLSDIVKLDSESDAPNTNDYNYAMAVINNYDRNIIPADAPACAAAFARIKTEYGVDSSAFLLSECGGALQFGFNSKKFHFAQDYLKSNANPVDDHLTLAQFIAGLKKLGRDHFYLYSGENDMFVPKENFTEELAATQGLLTYHHFPTSGHDGFHTEELVLEDLLKPETVTSR